jgi:hypothetical protein
MRLALFLSACVLPSIFGLLGFYLDNNQIIVHSSMWALYGFLFGVMSTAYMVSAIAYKT